MQPDKSTFLSSIPDRLSQAVSLYEKMLPVLSNDQDRPPPDPDRAHPLVYAEASLRCARFYLAVWESGGSIDEALKRLCARTPTDAPANNATPLQSDRSALSRSLSPANTVPRSSIATWASLAYSPHIATLALPVRLRVTGEVASIFGRIGYRRKEGFVLRELAALCAEGVTGGADEGAGKQAVSHPSPIPEEQTPNGEVARTNGTHPPAQQPSTVVSSHFNSAGNDSIIRIAERVCEAFGVAVVSRAKSQRDRRSSVAPISVISSDVRTSTQFGWANLQVGGLKDSISIAEALQGSVRDCRVWSRFLRISPQIIKLPCASLLRLCATFRTNYGRSNSSS